MKTFFGYFSKQVFFISYNKTASLYVKFILICQWILSSL